MLVGCCAGRRVSCSSPSPLLLSALRLAAPSGRLGPCKYATLVTELSASCSCSAQQQKKGFGGWVGGGGGREGGGLEGGWGGCCVSGIKVQLSTHKLNLTPSPSPLVSLHALSPPSSFSFFLFFAVSLLNSPSCLKGF